MKWININEERPHVDNFSVCSEPVLVWMEAKKEVCVDSYHEEGFWVIAGNNDVKYWSNFSGKGSVKSILAELGTPYDELKIVDEMFNSPMTSVVSRKECFDIVSEKMINSATVDALIEKAEILYNFLNQ